MRASTIIPYIGGWGGEIAVERRPPHREIGFGFVFVSCVPCVRAGEAKLRASVREKFVRRC